ncbi:MAG: GAF domain-containing sensor histidine kinase [Deltaproteobacteria bacterium]|nr:GAF domain-containing sensor histidine kinase [Deltaproteobacteria bacterium]
MVQPVLLGTVLVVVTSIVSLTVLIYRWPVIRAWCRRRLRQRFPYDLRRIMEEEVARLHAIPDRRQRYPLILETVARFARATSCSLLVRNGEGGRFVLKESYGAKPISFQVGDLTEFITWLSKRGRTVTRRELVERAECAEAKACGLHYCIQFLAEACVPCFLGGELLAVINVGPPARGSGFAAELLDLLDLLSGQFALAIHNAALYEDMLRRNLQLEELGRLKSRLLANISHELRTPLTSIIGWSDLLLEGGDGALSGDQHRHCGMIRDAGRRLLETVSTMVDLSKLEANHLSLDVRRINLKRLFAEVAEGLQLGSKTRLELKIGEEGPSVYGDVEWLRRVVFHLLTNAVKYTAEGEIWVDLERAGEMVKVGVHDTGIGIEPDKQRAIFFPFVQANAGADRPYEGNGLGLVISRKVVELHGGRMWLTSHPGRGSHFYFTLPLKPTTIRSAELRGNGTTSRQVPALARAAVPVSRGAELWRPALEGA